MSDGIAGRNFFLGRQWRGQPYLLSPFLDFMCAGGLAVLTLISLFFLFPVGRTDLADATALITGLMFYVAFLLNDPHFTASYLILYKDYPAKLRRFRGNRGIWLRYVVAGIVAPGFMACYFLYALLTHNSGLFVTAMYAMMVLVGWHYMKQAFGVFMMLSALKKTFYGPRRRFFLLLNSYVCWACYVTVLFTTPIFGVGGSQVVWDITYGNMNLVEAPEEFLAALGALFIASGLASVIVMVWDRKQPSASAIIGYLSMYYLLFAAAFHPLWILLYPAFHSLQYLLFVYAYKRGETAVLSQQSPELATGLNRRFLGFGLLAVVGGILLFNLIPNGLEQWLNPDKTLILPIVGAFIIFINVHHYFIDNVIWRREHAELSRYLFHRG